MAQLRVVRFRTTAISEACELALCIPRSDGFTKVIYGNREITCDAQSLCKAHDVNVDNMLNKATVLDAVVRDEPALRRKLFDYPDVCARLDADLIVVHATNATHKVQIAPHRPQVVLRDNSAAVCLRAFQDAHLSKSGRFRVITDAVQDFTNSSQNHMPSGWSKTRLPVDGMEEVNLLDPKTMRQVSALCKVKQLKPPTGFVKSHSYHYGKYDHKKLVSILSLSVMKMNNIPGSIAVCIDIAASTDKNHSMTRAIKSIQRLLRKRRNPCVMFAQVAQTDIARTFWAGKLTKTRRASVLVALLSSFDSRYKIYSDAEDMAIFYE